MIGADSVSLVRSLMASLLQYANQSHLEHGKQATKDETQRHYAPSINISHSEEDRLHGSH